MRPLRCAPKVNSSHFNCSGDKDNSPLSPHKQPIKHRKMKAAVHFLALAALMATGSTFASCDKSSDVSTESNVPVLDVKSEGTSFALGANLTGVLPPSPPATPSEADMLTYMKEEEKLAKDVYTTLNAKWNVQIFTNIANAEATHINAVVGLMEHLGVSNTALLPVGEFQNPEFTILYNQLVAQGSISLAEAYKVGALIEDKDIFDVSTDMQNTSNASILLVFDNLKRASGNHLRAFTKQLTALGTTYTPQFIDQATYAQIIGTPMEQGKQYKKRNGR